jgi:hypothetical protein
LKLERVALKNYIKYKIKSDTGKTCTIFGILIIGIYSVMWINDTITLFIWRHLFPTKPIPELKASKFFIILLIYLALDTLMVMIRQIIKEKSRS